MSLEINKSKLNLSTTATATTTTAVKKPFIFNSPSSSCLSEASSTTDQDLFKVVLQPVFSRAPQQQQQQSQALLSPCQALENFNFNSPKVEKSVFELFESSIQSEDLNSNSGGGVKFRNSEQDKLKYIPKSFTISDGLSETTGTTNSFKLCLSRKITTNYKRTATEKINILDIEQENFQDNSDDNLTSSLSSSIDNDSKQKQQTSLARPSSICLSRQHLLPIKETNPNIQQQLSFSSTTTSSSYLQQNTPTDPQNSEFQFDLTNKKMRLSPITDINPIHSNSQLLLLQNRNKSKSSENLVKTVNDNFDFNISSFSRENYSFHKSQSTNLNIETESTFETVKNRLDENMKNNSTKSSKSSLHGSIEKMIEVS